jgi:hypothetical protein
MSEKKAKEKRAEEAAEPVICASAPATGCPHEAEEDSKWGFCPEHDWLMRFMEPALNQALQQMAAWVKQLIAQQTGQPIPATAAQIKAKLTGTDGRPLI